MSAENRDAVCGELAEIPADLAEELYGTDGIPLVVIEESP